MKSKSFDFNQAQTDNGKLHKTFDFANLYKSESETSAILAEKRKSDDDLVNGGSKSKHEDSKRERSPNKIRKKRKNDPVDISHISIDGSNLNSSVGPSTPRNKVRSTSTPKASAKTVSSASKVKSIMKSTIVNDDDNMDGKETIIHKPKKRNKSVSFMLDDNEEVVVKKTKSDNSISKKKDDNDTKQKLIKEKKKHLKKLRKERLCGKENQIGDNNEKVIDKMYKKNVQSDTVSNSAVTVEATETQVKKRKVKKNKKDVEHSAQSNTDIEKPPEPKKKKAKKIKHQGKYETDEQTAEAQHNDIKPDVIAEDLENLKIGDNAHTLSSLLDEMSVADKTKWIKNKSKHKDNKNVTSNTVKNQTVSNEDEKEKIKWKKRKWNKDKKGDVDMSSLATSVIVENVPIALILTYKKIVTSHFLDCGLVKSVGVAEMYPTVESKPVFTTTVNFFNEQDAIQALTKNNTLLEGSPIQVSRPLPATETTLVLRTYGELTEQLVCSLLAGAGKIRYIRHVVKGKKATSTAFVEMDGPGSVKKALKLATGAKIGGKKIYVSKFELRSNKKSKMEDETVKKENGANE